METLNRDTTKILSEIKTHSCDFGTDCINHLNEMMHYFTSSNNDIKSLINNKNDYDNETEPTAKEKHLNAMFEKLDKVYPFDDDHMQEFRYSLMQVNKLLTEIEIYRARNPN